MKKKVLVIGAGGFIGSHLAEKLSSLGYKVKAFVHYNSGNSWGWLDKLPSKNKLEVICGDVRNYDSIRSATIGIDTIFHLAALIGIPYSYTSPESYVETNIKGTLNVLQAGRDSNVKRFIHTSTSEVYGTAQFVPIDETHPINPQSPYAASKAGADYLALSFYRSFGLPVTVIRPFNTYGPRQSSRAVVPTIITQMLQKRSALKLGSLFPTRDLTFVEDTVEGFINAALSSKAIGEVINLGSNSEISIGDLAGLIAKILHSKIKIISEVQRKRPKASEVARLRADNNKAMSLLGWRPKYSLEEGLKKTVAWFSDKDNLKKYKAGVYTV